MEYAAMTFWLFVIVFSALGVHKITCSLVRPKILNTMLLPGTLVAQLGYILGLLITGGTVNNTSLIKDDDSGEPQTGKDTETRIPVIGAIVVALLPMIGCGVDPQAIGRISWVMSARICGASGCIDAQGSSSTWKMVPSKAIRSRSMRPPLARMYSSSESSSNEQMAS